MGKIYFGSGLSRRKISRMPIYEYKCKVCGAEKEVIASFSAPPPPCDNKDHKKSMVRKISKNNFHLKGSGWYKDSYGLKEK